MKALIAGLAVLVGGLLCGQTGPGNSADPKKLENSKMGIMVIVAYRPKAGREAALLDLVRRHHPRLKEQGLVTDRPAYAMQARDGTILEVFEWKTQKALDEAHNNPAVQKMWGEFGEACDYVPLSQLAEAREMFAGFAPVDMSR